MALEKKQQHVRVPRHGAAATTRVTQVRDHLRKHVLLPQIHDLHKPAQGDALNGMDWVSEKKCTPVCSMRTVLLAFASEVFFSL